MFWSHAQGRAGAGTDVDVLGDEVCASACLRTCFGVILTGDGSQSRRLFSSESVGELDVRVECRGCDMCDRYVHILPLSVCFLVRVKHFCC